MVDTTTSMKMTTLAIQNLFSYVEEENLSAVKAHLDKFKEVDGRSDNGQTPLMLAAEQGSLEIVQELIRRGANVNLDDVDCWTALISSAKEGHVDVVKELLESGAYIEHRDMGGWTALMWAAYKGRVEVAKILLENGANPNTTGQYSVYPIIWAAGRGHAQIVHLLLHHGAKVNCSDKYGTTPLIWAARKGHYDCVMHLLENGADVDQEGANSMTALIVAVKGGYTEVVKELLKRNPNVNMTDKDGNTALMIAAKEGYTEIVQDLLDAGTYVNIPDRSGDTVLIGAVRGGHVEIVRALLQKYADIDIRGQDNKTALYWAVEKGNATMVRDILQCNPDTETCTKDSETPLIKATKMRNIEIVELLLDKGAKVSAVDKKGDTPLHIAIRGRSRRLAELLLRNPKDGRLLYRPNKAGETPYNIDCSHQKSILTQIFGAREISKNIPTTKDVEPLLEIDGDVRSFEVFLSSRTPVLTARDIKTFLPCTVNLDPKLREIIADVRAAREQMNMGGVTYPTLPLQDAPARAPSVYSQHSSACSPTASFNGPYNQVGVVSPQPPSSYFSGMTGPQHPFYNRPYFPHHVYHLPRQYVGSAHHALPRPTIKTGFPRDPSSGLHFRTHSFRQKKGPPSLVSGAPAVLLSSMNTDTVCERMKQIEGIDQSMLGQYTSTIKKANVNGRVLSQCNLDELKKEMNMNFGDWQLFRGMVMEMRHTEQQVLHEGAPSEQGGSMVGHAEMARRTGGVSHESAINPDTSPMYNFNLSFEELSTVGLDEPQRHSNTHWAITTHRTPSMSSLNSQESSNDISKLTDKQQAEYRNAYQEYIAQMAQLEGANSGTEKPVQPHPGQFMHPADDKGKEAGEQDGRKPFAKRGSSKSPDAVDYTSSAADASPLDPITEEDEKPDHTSSKMLLGRKTSGDRVGLFQGADLKLKGAGGPRYQKLTSDDEESEESDNTPLLGDGKKPDAKAAPDGTRPVVKGKEYLSDAMLDKKDSSDSGVRSSESSPNHSLQDEEADLSQLERSSLIELDEENTARKRGLPHSLSGLQDPTVARMSICSEDQCSLLASSPEESWPSSKAYNLNRTPSNTTLNNNTNNTQLGNRQQPSEGTPSDVIVATSSSTAATTAPVDNVRVVHFKRGLNPGDPPEIRTVSSETVTFGEERESIL
ncbi:kinase D-interacting substrate of 220 kDa-like [Arapaima gigas]